jgi:hypothetical protein
MSRHTVKTPLRAISYGPPCTGCGARLEHWPMVSVRRHTAGCGQAPQPVLVVP